MFSRGRRNPRLLAWDRRATLSTGFGLAPRLCRARDSTTVRLSTDSETGVDSDFDFGHWRFVIPEYRRSLFGLGGRCFTRLAGITRFRCWDAESVIIPGPRAWPTVCGPLVAGVTMFQRTAQWCRGLTSILSKLACFPPLPSVRWPA